MQLFDLMDCLEKDFNELFKDSQYEVKGETDDSPSQFKKPQILQGWYTEKKSKEDFPYIMISPVKDGTTWEENTLQLTIIFASFGFNSDGWKDCALMANEVKRFFNERQNIGNRFPILKDSSRAMEIEYPDQQPYPEWYCFMKVEFNAYNAAMTGIRRIAEDGQGIAY